MENETTFITQKGLEKLKKELEGLKTVKRKEIAWRIQEAKELGDLSENAEYAEAKNEQAFMEGRISELENILRNVTIIENHKNDHSKVTLGSKVKVEAAEKTVTYVIVGPNEINPEEGKISHESPLGRAFLGKRIGEVIQIAVPNGRMDYKIISIG